MIEPCDCDVCIKVRNYAIYGGQRPTSEEQVTRLRHINRGTPRPKEKNP